MRVSAGKYNVLLARFVIVITAIVVWAVFYQAYENKAQQHEQLTQKLNQQVKRFNKLSDLSILVEDYADRFNTFMPVEQFEDENRLYWLDQLELIRIRHQIPKLQYAISSRQPYKYNDGLIKDKGIQVKVSEMRLTMGLLHLGDLVSVLDDLERIKSSVPLVTSCELRLVNTNKNAGLISARENIQAVCHVKWFTFKVS